MKSFNKPYSDEHKGFAVQKRGYGKIKCIYSIVGSEIENALCSKCGKSKYVVKVVNNRTGEVQWRCNNCVRELRDGGREIAHYELTPRELKDLKTI